MQRIKNELIKPLNICLMALLLSELGWAIFLIFQIYTTKDMYQGDISLYVTIASQMIVGVLTIFLYILYRKPWLLIISLILLIPNIFSMPNIAVSFYGAIIGLYVLYSHKIAKHIGKTAGRKELLILVTTCFTISSFAMLVFVVPILGGNFFGYVSVALVIGSVVLIVRSMSCEGLLLGRLAGACYLVGIIYINFGLEDFTYGFSALISPEIFLALFLAIAPVKWQKPESNTEMIEPEVERDRSLDKKSKLRPIFYWIGIPALLIMLISINIVLHLVEYNAPIKADYGNCYLVQEGNRFSDGIFAFGEKTVLISAKDGKRYIVGSGELYGDISDNYLYYSSSSKTHITRMDLTNKSDKKLIVTDVSCWEVTPSGIIYLEDSGKEEWEREWPEYTNLFMKSIVSPFKDNQISSNKFSDFGVFGGNIIAVDEQNIIWCYSCAGELLAKTTWPEKEESFLIEHGMISPYEFIYSIEEPDNLIESPQTVKAIDVRTGVTRKLFTYDTQGNGTSEYTNDGLIYYFEYNKLKEYNPKTKHTRTVYSFQENCEGDLYFCDDYIIAEVWFESNYDQEFRYSVDYQGNLAFHEEIPKSAGELVLEWIGFSK